MIKYPEHRNILRFACPIIIENVLIIVIGLLTFMLMGKISGSALAVVGVSNNMLALILSAFAILTNGSAILTSRLIGANENGEASEVIEQSIHFAVVGGLLMAAVLELTAPLIARLMMPNADEAVLREAASFFRILALSFPFLLVFMVLSNVMRSSGNSILPMLCDIFLNLIMLLSCYLLVTLGKLGLSGVGISYTLARFVGMVIMLIVILRSNYNFHVSISSIFKPKYSIFKRIAKIGLPISIEATLVQAGYLIANIMAVGIGIRSAEAYQVSTTIYTFFSLPQGICSTISMVMAGLLIGANKYEEAKKTVLKILCYGLAASLVVSLPLALCGKLVSSFYSSDVSVIAESAKILWILLAMTVPAIFINAFDPALRAGGDPKFVMCNSIVGVWLVRLPLTYLFCYRLNMGVAGIYLANIAGLSSRAVIGVIRFRRGKWLHKVI